MADVPHYEMYIDGRWAEAAETFEVRSPAHGALIAIVAQGDLASADAAVAAAQAAHESGVWRNRTPHERADLIDAIADNMAARLDELTALQVNENGATVRAARSFLVGASIAHLRYFASLARSYAFETAGPLSTAPVLGTGLIRKEPVGVCAGIVPWNFPLLLAVWKLGPAVAAGNTIVLKPDEKTPLTLLALARIAEECELPAGVLNVVTGEGEEVGAHLAAHPDVRKIAFTGSTAVGREIMRTAAGNVKRVTLELGGKGPNVVLDDADVETAVDGALFACYLYSGQACESGTRVLLPDALHDEFVERMVARASNIVIGDPADFATDIGPVISAEQRDRILGYIEQGKREGATVALGGRTPDRDKGYWVQPTIFTGVTNDMTIAREEIFGPVISVIKYGSVEEAIRIANDTEYGLSAGVWSADNERALEVAERLEAGTVWVNDWHMVSCEYPFGGYKQSGLGRELGPNALDEYTEAKFIHLDLSGRRDRRVYDMIVPGGET